MIKEVTLESNWLIYDMKTFVKTLLDKYGNTDKKDYVLKWKDVSFYSIDNFTGKYTTYTKDVSYLKPMLLTDLEYTLAIKIYTPTRMKNHEEVDEICEEQIKLLVENFNKGLTLLNTLTTIGIKEIVIDHKDLLDWQNFVKNVEMLQRLEDTL